MDDTKKEQVEIFERLQLLVLKEFERKLEANECSGTDLSTLVRLMEHNGWTFDIARVPQGLKDKLTSRISATRFNEGDADIVGKIA